MNNRKQREGIRKPPPDYVGGKLKRDCGEQSVMVAEVLMVYRKSSDGRVCIEIWRRPRFFSMAAEARQMPWKRGLIVERGAEKFGGRCWMCALQI